MISVRAAANPSFKGCRALVLFPALSFTWIEGEHSFGLSLIWLLWSVTLAWGLDTTP